MTAYATGLSPSNPLSSPISRAEIHARMAKFDRPTLVMDLEAVAARFHALKSGLSGAAIHYAVKANPAPELIRRLAAEGSSFDAASRAEIALCLECGAAPDQISFGNTIKKAADIAYAYEAGVRLFAVDAEEELLKLAAHAPGAEVYVRVLIERSEADWPLSRKFGCAPAMALSLMDKARALGLVPVGISFHVGSQTRRAGMWREALDDASAIWAAAHSVGHALTLVNIGGGFPASYDKAVDAPDVYAAEVMALVRPRFPGASRIMAEPGRGMVAEAGVIAAEVVLTSRKKEGDPRRWIYLDIGRFSGLAETEGEAIRYQIGTDHDGGRVGPCILAGPSCDSADVLYEKQSIDLPMDLRAGDRVFIRATGAYTSTYSSVGFNGFPPLDVVCI